jgi:TatD DNase family protein
VIGESPEAAGRALELVTGDPRLSATAGVHPHVASTWSAERERWLRETLRDPRVVAVGETGLDYHYDFSPREAQRRAFEAHLALAAETGKPVIIHAREADEDLAVALRNQPRTTAILHSFSSGLGLLRTGIELGHYVSFSGMITFRNWRLPQALVEVPAERLLVETDAPYLAPVPHRGKRNEPGYVVEVAKRLAEARGTSYEEMAALTTRNAGRVFGSRVSE